MDSWPSRALEVSNEASWLCVLWISELCGDRWKSVALGCRPLDASERRPLRHSEIRALDGKHF